MAYHVAVPGGLSDPQGRFSSDGILPLSTLKGAPAETPESLRQLHKALSLRVKDEYLRQLTRKVCAILKTCRDWQVQLVVFPELSIPAAVLEAIAHTAGDMVVVAGSCFVDSSMNPKDSVYTRMGWHTPPRTRQNIAPVIHAGQIIGLTAKLHGVTGEQEFDISLAKSWAPVPLPEQYGGPLAVLICLDYLERTTNAHTTLVAPQIDNCRAIAVPALTSFGSQPLFQGHQVEDSGPGRRPVFFANHTPGGGSTIAVGHRRIEEHKLYPEHPGILDAGEEGVIVTDVDLGIVGVGKGGRYGETPLGKPFAAASLVYTGTAPGLANWLANLSGKLPDLADDDDEYEALVAAKAWIAENPPPIHEATTIQKRRWGRLMQVLEDATGLEILRRLVREVELPQDVLPLPEVQKALSEGAGLTLEDWIAVKHDCAASLAPAASDLRRLGQGSQSRHSGWTDIARQTWTDIARAVHNPTSGPPGNSLTESLDRATETIENQIIKTAIDEGNELAKEGHYEKAKLAFTRAILEARYQGSSYSSHSAKWALWEARAAIGAASCALNLQDVAEARQLVENINVEVLDPRRKIALANIWAVLEEAERANAILSSLHTLSEDEARDAKVVIQRIGILRGNIPSADELAPSLDIRLLAASLTLERSQPQEASEMAADILKSPDSNPMFRAEAIRVLLSALTSVAEEPTISDPPLRLFELVALVEKEVPSILTLPIPSPTRNLLLAAWRNFLACVRDADALLELEDPENRTDAIRMAFQEAEGLAASGQLDAAYEVLPRFEHPWRTKLVRAEFLAQTQRLHEALSEVLSLAEQFPGIVVVDLLACDLLLLAGRPKDAYKYGKSAFDSMPARGARLRMAECFIAVGRPTDAWNVLSDYETETGPRLFRVLVHAAERVKPNLVKDILNRQLVANPQDISTVTRLAQHLFAWDDLDQASTIAWSEIEASSERMTIEQLHQLGLFQVFSNPPPERHRRVREVANILKRRFPTDPAAENARFKLFEGAGLLRKEIASIDFGLLGKAGYVLASTVDMFVDSQRQQAVLTHGVMELGRQGHLPVSIFCASVQPPITVPIVMTRLFERDRVEVPFSTPPGLEDTPSAFSLHGGHILTSEVELYLLGVLELLEPLRSQLGTDGRFHVPYEAWKHIVEDRARLHVIVQEAEPERIARLTAQLSALPRITLPQAQDGFRAEDRDGIVIGFDNGLPRMSVLRRLRDEGRIASRTVERLGQFFLDEPQISLTELPETVLVEVSFLELLLEHGVFHEFVNAIHRVYISQDDWFQLHLKHQLVSENHRALGLCEGVHRWLINGIKCGSVDIVPECEVDGIPTLRDESNQNVQQLIMNPLRWAVRYADILRTNAAWWRVSADFFGSTAPFMPGMVPHFAWKGETELRNLLSRLRKGMDRHVSLPALVRKVLGAESFGKLVKLANLGFPDALGCADIISLFEEYGGLQGVVPARTLDRLEWMAREPRHLGGETARLRLQRVYADALFRSFCGEPRSIHEEEEDTNAFAPALTEEGARLFGSVLLERAESVAQASRTDFLTSVIYFAALRGTTATAFAWRRGDSALETRTDGPLRMFWHFVEEWARSTSLRWAAFNRTISACWVALAKESEVQRKLDAATLPRVSLVVGESRRFISLAEESEAILSSLWGWRPTSTRGVGVRNADAQERTILDEEILALGAESETKFRVFRGGRFVAYSFPLEEGLDVEVIAPSEAILLRQPPDDMRRFSKFLGAAVGVHDGRLYFLLEKLSQDPSRAILHAALAHRATLGLWRRVRDDASYIVSWPKLGVLGRGSLRELRRILSEPCELESQESMAALLTQRVENGIWHHRADRWDLLKNALEVPGPLSIKLVASLVANEFESHLQEALETVERASEEPIARVMRSVVLLRVGAEQGVTLRRPSGEEVQLDQRFPQILCELLEQEASASRVGTFAEAEAAILRICRSVITDLAHAGPLQDREILWLTYRLFQWLRLQMDFIPDENAREEIARLKSMAPPAGRSSDLLDPLGFGREQFDHRLACLLYALGIMEDFAAFLRPGGQPEQAGMVPRKLSWAPQMVDQLIQLADGEGSSLKKACCLGWDAPQAIEDLALVALLRVESASFVRLSPLTRIARISSLPEAPDEMSCAEQALFLPLVNQIVLTCALLSAEERTQAVNRVRAMRAGVLAERWRMMIYSGVLGSPDAGVEEAEALSSLKSNICDPMAPMSLALLINGLHDRGQEFIIEVLDSVASEVARHGLDQETFLGKLARCFNQTAEPSRSLVLGSIARVASRLPSEDREKILAILQLGETASNCGSAT